MVEFQPSKLAVAGSNPVARSSFRSLKLRREPVRVRSEEGTPLFGEVTWEDVGVKGKAGKGHEMLHGFRLGISRPM